MVPMTASCRVAGDARKMDAMRRVHVIVAGDVQGVGYRYTMRLEARALGVTGWVRNRADGTVEAEVEGTAEQVDAALAWMAQGPPGSHVADARVTELSLTSAESSFEVRPTA
jgi:acylphosphatase